jgi:hypothetical protein
VAGFGVERLIEALALDEMRGALGGRQFGAAEVFVDLEQFGRPA